MFATIFRLIGVGGIKTIIEAIANARAKARDADNEADRIAASREADMWEAQLEARTRAQSTFGLAACMRMFLGIPFGIFIWKVVVYDKVFGLGSTEPLGETQGLLMAIVFGFYFLSEFGIQYIRKR